MLRRRQKSKDTTFDDPDDWPQLPRERRLPDDIWLPEVGSKIPGRTGWRAVFAKWFLPYR
jgi:hypothetical protein